MGTEGVGKLLPVEDMDLGHADLQPVSMGRPAVPCVSTTTEQDTPNVLLRSSLSTRSRTGSSNTATSGRWRSAVSLARRRSGNSMLWIAPGRNRVARWRTGTSWFPQGTRIPSEGGTALPGSVATVRDPLISIPTTWVPYGGRTSQGDRRLQHIPAGSGRPAMRVLPGTLGARLRDFRVDLQVAAPVSGTVKVHVTRADTKTAPSEPPAAGVCMYPARTFMGRTVSARRNWGPGSTECCSGCRWPRAADPAP